MKVYPFYEFEKQVMHTQPATGNVSDDDRIPFITLQLNRDGIAKFTALLQSPFELEATVGEPLLSFLLKLPGFTAEYIEKDVQTILLNGEPVDDVYTPLTEPGAVIALSAVVPGLGVMGAMFRKGSIHTSPGLESHHAAEAENSGKHITISLKLFNYIAQSRGAEILRRGISISTATVLTFFETRPWLCEQVQAVKINETCTHDTKTLMCALKSEAHCHFRLTHEELCL